MAGAVVLGVALIALAIGTFTDLRKREVPDLVNYSLIAIGLFFNLMMSIALMEWSYIINSIAGFAAFFAFALLMFYSGQWGGGDSKMIMGIGALIGLDITFKDIFLINFFVNMLIAGAFYGLLWSIALALMHWKKVLHEMKRYIKTRQIVFARNLLLFSSLVFAAFIFLAKDMLLQLSLAILIAVSIAAFCLWIFIKAVEKTAMLKYISPDKLTEGDWIAEEVKHKGKAICSPKDLGISKKQIRQLINLYKERKIRQVLIKEGIPFVPSFLAGFILTLVFGNILVLAGYF